jgi:hypothetical protein
LIILLSAHILIIFSLNFISRPLILARLLLFRVITTSCLLRMLRLRWFFFFLTLVFLGGVMVIVLFLCSVCSNKKLLSVYTFNFKYRVSICAFFFVTMTFFFNYITIEIFFPSSIIISLYQKESNILFIILVVTLLICMLCVISVTKLDRGEGMHSLAKDQTHLWVS